MVSPMLQKLTVPAVSLLALVLQACSQGAGSPEPSASASDALLGAPGAPGAVYTQTNAADHNALLAFSRAPDGTLTPAGQFDTGGAGLGAGLSAQGALAREGRWLFVVNAGSNDVTTFDLLTGTPSVVSRTPSGGTMPVSVAARGGLVYVLNAGDPGNIAGFWVDFRGGLHSLGTRPLSGANVTPTEVAFAPDGRSLVVTEKGTNLIDTYDVDVPFEVQGPTVTPSDGPAPFGFDFTPRGQLVVSEAASSAASSYAIHDEVDLASISASVANGQAAACWLVVSPDGRHAFTANAGNGTLSSYDVDAEGRLALDQGVAASTGAASHPVDMAFAAGGRLLYSLANGSGTLTAFRVQGGSLASLGQIGSIPTSASGLVAW
jgi:6-phosphogluconolactonase (cycloisomerase 2 family)